MTSVNNESSCSDPVKDVGGITHYSILVHHAFDNALYVVTDKTVHAEDNRKQFPFPTPPTVFIFDSRGGYKKSLFTLPSSENVVGIVYFNGMNINFVNVIASLKLIINKGKDFNECKAVKFKVPTCMKGFCRLVTWSSRKSFSPRFEVRVSGICYIDGAQHTMDKVDYKPICSKSWVTDFTVDYLNFSQNIANLEMTHHAFSLSKPTNTTDLMFMLFRFCNPHSIHNILKRIAELGQSEQVGLAFPMCFEFNDGEKLCMLLHESRHGIDCSSVPCQGRQIVFFSGQERDNNKEMLGFYREAMDHIILRRRADNTKKRNDTGNTSENKHQRVETQKENQKLSTIHDLDEVICTGTRTLEERNREGFENAIIIE